MHEQPTHDRFKAQFAVVTGSTDGIGKQIALGLARGGAQILIVGRNPQKAQRVLEEIRAIHPSASPEFATFDLSLMQQVEQLAEQVRQCWPKIDLLVHAAGVMLPKRTLTAEGIETVFAVQYLARHHLTYRLLDHFNSTSRILSVSAAGTMPLPLDFDNLNGEKFYQGVVALMQESVANDLFALRFMRHHPQVRYYNYGPFYVRSNLFTQMPAWFRFINATVGELFAIDPPQAADEALTLLGNDLASGQYSRGVKFVPPTRYRLKEDVQERLHQASQTLIDNALTQKMF
ncbi:MAG: SDR family NAD(P)-dependent oxidoreductase [Phototrophicaceae bacterium]